MSVSRDDIKSTLNAFFQRVEIIRAAGGISRLEFINGRQVPEGWIEDAETDFFVPPNLSLNPTPTQ